MLAIVTLLAVNIGIAGSISAAAAPENITVTFLNPTSVKVSWQTYVDQQITPIDKYDVTYKPTDARVVAVVAGNSEAVTLSGLTPDTQYQLTVTAVWSGKKYRSRPIVFRTLEPPRSSPQQDSGALGGGGGGGIAGGGPTNTNGIGLSSSSSSTSSSSSSSSSSLDGTAAAAAAAAGQSITYADEFGNLAAAAENSTTRELPTIRGVEVGIVVLVLIVWAGAIALFFNRWGKIRMLLPYQPDYKQEQLKVPGTGVCSSGACNGQHSHQHFHHGGWQEDQQQQQQQQSVAAVISDRCSRNRINSAIFVSSEGKGFDSIEFLRRHGSQSVLCRKARSAENITDEDRKRRFSENREWEGEDENDIPNETTIELAECYHTTTTNGIGNRIINNAGDDHPINPNNHSAVIIHNQTPPVDIIESHIITISKTPPKLTILPTLSISGPSPPLDEEDDDDGNDEQNDKPDKEQIL